MKLNFTKIFTVSLLFLFVCVNAQIKQVKGKITDDKGKALSNVTVSTSDGEISITDSNGNYEISAQEGTEISYDIEGFEMKHQKVGESNFVNITMKSTTSKIAQNKELDEVVVMGFGKQRTLAENTGTATVISGKDLNQIPVASVDKMLAGRVPGLLSNSASGQPGGLAQLRLRGVTSILGNNNPLWIVDGVRIQSGDVSIQTTSSNVLAGINQNDIENITVLKDAAATAIYGADGGAGVIIITTKRGKNGEPRINLDMETGFSKKSYDKLKSLNTSQWVELLKEANKNAGISGTESPDWAMNTYGIDENIYTNWQDLTVKKVAVQNSINLSLTGGTDKMKYVSSINYFKQDGIEKNSDFQRVAGKLGIDYKISDKFLLSNNFDISFNDINALTSGGGFSNPILSNFFSRPSDSAYNPDGSFNLGNNGRLSNGLFNPLYLQKYNFMNLKIIRLLYNIKGDYSISKNLKYTIVFAPEYLNIEEKIYLNPIHGDGQNLKGSLQNSIGRIFNWNFQNILSYYLKISDKHNFDFRLVQEAFKSDLNRLRVNNKTTAKAGFYNLDNYVINTFTQGRGFTSSRLAFASNLGYNYAKKYYFDGTLRREGISNFSENNKWGTFWSLGGAYNIANENFLKNSKIINLLKLKASYGKLGNALNSIETNAIGQYFYDQNYDNNAAAYPRGVSNDNFSWERVNQLDLGMDTQLFNKRLSLGITYYDKKTENLILNQPLSYTSGAYAASPNTDASMVVNIGDMTNRGWEFQIDGVIIQNENDGFQWNIGGNFAIVNNKINNLPFGESISGINIRREGEVVNSFYLRKWAGVDPNNGDPLWYIDGIGGETTNNYSKAQRAIQGSPLPKYTAGFNTDFSYNNLSLSLTFSGAFGHKVYDGWAFYTLNSGQNLQLYPGSSQQLDRWTTPGQESENPKIILGGNKQANSNSSRFLYNGDYIKLRDITLGYSLPNHFVKNTKLNFIKFYLRGTNIFTYVFDDKLKFDPEVNLNDGSSNLELPNLKSYTFGVNIGF